MIGSESKNRKVKKPLSVFLSRITQAITNRTQSVTIIQSIVFSPFFLWLYYTMNKEESQEPKRTLRTNVCSSKAARAIIKRTYVRFYSRPRECAKEQVFTSTCPYCVYSPFLFSCVCLYKRPF